MIKSCPKCYNEVVGEFTPSNTRKMLTTLAKKGGSKAVFAEDTDNNSLEETEISRFDDILNDYVENFGCIIENEDISRLYNNINELKRCADKTETPIIQSQYYYLVALIGLFYCMKHFDYESSSVPPLLRIAKEYIVKALEILNDDEYLIVADSINLLMAKTAKDCLYFGILDYEKLDFEHNIFEAEYLQSIYEECLFLTIDTIAKESKDDQQNEQLWILVLQRDNIKYIMYALVELFWIYLGDDDDMPSDRCVEWLIMAYNAPGFSIESIDVNDYFDSQWLIAYESYAFNLINGSMPSKGQDISTGFSMLQKVAGLESCFAKNMALADLGLLFEEGKYVEQDLEKALYYYTQCNYEEAICRINKQLSKI